MGVSGEFQLCMCHVIIDFVHIIIKLAIAMQLLIIIQLYSLAEQTL